MSLCSMVETEIIVSIKKDRICPTLKKLSTRLGVSERTLRRRLSQEGTSVQALADRARMKIIRQLPDSSLESLAETLGYSEAKSVSRLIRKNENTLA